MDKNFDAWNEKQKHINEREGRLYFKEGEIWWAHLGVNIGYEVDGKGSEYTRPVIIIKKYNRYSFLALPLTTSDKTNKYRVSVGIIDTEKAVANLSQIRNIDSKRLAKKIGKLDKEIFEDLKRKTSQVNFG